MKKFLSLILMFTFLLSICLVSVGAESTVGDLTQDMAEELAFEAYKTLSIFSRGVYVPISYEPSAYMIALLNEYSIYHTTTVEISFSESSDGTKYMKAPSYSKFLTGAYFPEGWEDKHHYHNHKLDREFDAFFGNISDVKKYMRKYFIEEVINNYLSSVVSFYDYIEDQVKSERHEFFRMSDSGELLIKNMNSIENGYYDWICEFGELTVQGEHAKINLAFCRSRYAYRNISNETIEFTKTSDGWRVSGGTAFEVMLGERKPNTNPNTGDTASVTVPTLTVAALVSLALPVAILRKRRRCA